MALRGDRVAQGCTQVPGQIVDPGAPLLQLRLRAAQPPRQPFQVLRAAFHLPVEGLRQRIARAAHRLQQVRAVRADQFRRARGRGGAYIGHEVGNREIGLVAHAGHHRHRTARNRVRHHFLVERPEILDAATAPAQDQHVAFAPRTGNIEHGGDLLRRAGALHRHRIDDDRHMGRAALERGQHVAHGRGLERGDHANRARVARNGSFAFGIEQTGLGKFFLETQESLVKIAHAGAAHRLHAQLQLAARLVHRHQRAHFHRLPFARGEIHVLVAPPEHHAADLRAGVLEREIPVAARRTREV
ncbi:hypothetical protein LMG19282_04945 [Cupriavidus campinensis]|nr:hypothetical protein LMG19282_04945 [Cupriavidus campinensis]